MLWWCGTDLNRLEICYHIWLGNRGKFVVLSLNHAVYLFNEARRFSSKWAFLQLQVRTKQIMVCCLMICSFVLYLQLKKVFLGLKCLASLNKYTTRFTFDNPSPLSTTVACECCLCCTCTSSYGWPIHLPYRYCIAHCLQCLLSSVPTSTHQHTLSASFSPPYCPPHPDPQYSSGEGE